MSHTYKKIIRGAVSLLIVFSCMAMVASRLMAEETRVLTLEQAIEIADKQNKDIRKAKEYITWTEGKYVEERAAALPQFLAGAGVSRSHDKSQLVFNAYYPEVIHRNNASVSVTQALFTWGQIGAAIRAAKEGGAFAQEQLNQYRQTVQKEVTMAFYDILLARELLELAKQNVRQKEKHLEESRNRLLSGVATDYDVLAADVALKNAKPDRIRAENLLKTAKEHLRFLLAMDKEAVDARGDLNIFYRRIPSFDEARAVAMGNRPELKAFDNRIKISEELVKIADSSDKPRVDFRGEYGWNGYNPTDMPSGDGEFWTVGVQLSFPFFDGLRTRGRVAQSKSDVRTVEIEKSKAIDSISLQLRDAIYAVNESEEIVKALSDNVTQAERLLSMAEKGYALGVKIRLEVDDAEMNLLQAKGNLSKAKRDYLSACANLDWIMGVLSPLEKKI